MNYSSNPLPLIDTLNDHTGFWLVVFVCVFSLMVLLCIDDDRKFQLQFFSVLILVAGLVSWNTGTITEPKNVKVEGTFVEFLNERHNETRSNGKTSSVVTVHKTFVVYEINGSSVLFPATPGTEYPKKAIFYGN